MKVRVISAIVALAIVVPFVIIGGIPFAGLIGLLSILGYKEILDLKKSHNDFPNIVKVLGLISLLYFILGDYGINSLYMSINHIRLIVPMFLLFLPTLFYKENKYTTRDAFYLLGSIYFIGIFFYLLMIVRNINIYLLIFLFSITAITDSFAYIIGRLIGKHKMAPTISPKKSWEGAIAGLIGGSIIPLIIYANLIKPIDLKIIIITIILSGIGQLGDLFLSKIKRENGIKDFSNLMPGHGGILDRLDSISFVVLAYVILTYML